MIRGGATMDNVFKALSDPTRRKLLDRLYAQNGLTMNELCEQLDMSRQAVAQHLALLESANLVSAVWKGRQKHHYLNPVPIHEIYDRWVKKFERRSMKALGDLKKRMEEATRD
jgi:DNA-binding transcriptional ArsR family regulator